jgi:protein-L-isoaspartate O-methyltransferase
MILEPKKIIPLLGIQHGMTILDIGSGVGFWAKPIADLVGASGNVIAVDYHTEIIQRLNHDIMEMGMKHIHAITGDIHNLADFPVKKYSCDKILLIRMGSVVHDVYTNSVIKLLDYVKDTGNIIIIDHLDYQLRLEKELAQFSDQLECQIIPLVEERNNHFFGMSVRKKVD